MTSFDPGVRLRVSGDRLVDGTGRTVVLRGFGLGGWMNLENFITGYPGTETQMRRALRAVLGEDAFGEFFDRFLDVFFGEDDARYLASLGMNALRVPFNYRHFEDDDRPFELKEEGFALLDRVIGRCADNGLYTILDLHALPGRQNQHWHSDNPTHWAEFWNHRHFADRVVHLWEALADRYKNNPWVAGYNPVNEPADPTGERIGPFYSRLERAIRAVDPDHILFLDGNTYSTDFSMFTEPFDNTVHTAHDYALPGIAADGEYPGTVRGRHVDKGVLEETFLDRTRFMRDTGTPIWIGEFGPIYTGDPVRDERRRHLLRDQLDIYAGYGASWSLWTYKDIGMQGLLHARPDGEYLTRIAPVLDRKRRLGVDAWGGDDRLVRQVLDPVEALFAEEFPEFDPYPWGAKPWLKVIVQNILFAEPMVGEFARCFEGVDVAGAGRLASDFSFSACVRREELAALLREYGGSVVTSAP
ncbi:MAG: endoglucanase [Actinomycetota bacterium]|nr:endoglucanase [Actinomycetota bacterium]